ncbi:MAG TPA: UDP-N-acetylmuramoyl-L-alanine--D-glutamate ligase [Sphingomonadales bacterium]|nr:UDP-N-acetylmuramoyl-L-alanine--D-glutamate ligase [Sphingomonadales bacterium]
MIAVTAYAGKKVGVFGLARSGLAAVAALAAGGARVLPWDDKAEARGMSSVPPVDLYEQDFSELAALVVSPGVPFTPPKAHPLVAKAGAANLSVIGDIELFALARKALLRHRFAAVTGTNGKSTTTALLAHALNACGIKAVGAGNIGVPALGIDPLPAGGVYVMELSSFQLDLTRSLRPEIAILLNISPDHLDRHGTMENYVAAKRRIFGLQDAKQVAVIGMDDDYGRVFARELKQKVIPISCVRAVEGGVFVLDGILFDAMAGEAINMGPIGNNRSLRGQHNGQNAAAVYAAAKELGAPPAAILASFRTFEGLPHRLEIVGEKDGVLFINDSKASNTGSALRSLEAYDNIHWIVGGLFKEASLEMFAPVLPKVRQAYTIGKDDAVFVQYLEGKVPLARCGTLHAAIEQAAAAAKKGDVVLLAPASASFDQFRNYEHRGETFRALAQSLIGGGNA